MIVKNKINKNESLIYLKKVNKFLVVGNENLKLIEAYSNKSTSDFKIYLKNNFPKNANNIEREINKLFTVERKSIDNHKIKFERPKKIFQFNFKVENNYYSIEYNDGKTISAVLCLLNHLQCDSNNLSEKIYVYYSEKYCLLKINNKKLVFKKEESHILSGRIISHLTSNLHQIKYKSWTGFLHGTTISKNNKGVIIMGKSGSGKTLASSILLKNGFELVCDDMSPLTRQGKIGYFPNAMSVKPSGYKKIKQLLDNSFHVCETTGPKGPTKYIYPKNNVSIKKLIPCQKIIKISFKKNSNLKISKIENKDLLIHFLDDSFINMNNVAAKSFINWFLNCECFEISYSQDNDLVAAINEII